MAHRARKRFGQNFLVDDTYIDRILDAIRPETGQRIIEIGPGQAALTLAAQNGGAGRYDRVRAAVRWSLLFGAAAMIPAELVISDSLGRNLAKILPPA